MIRVNPSQDSRRSIPVTAPHIVDPAGLLGEALAEASPVLMRSLLQTDINALLSADADGGDRRRVWPALGDAHSRAQRLTAPGLDIWVGTIDVAIPRLRTGTYLPEWLLERRKRSESALITVVADCGLLPRRRVDPPHRQAGQDPRHPLVVEVAASRMATELDAQVGAFRHRPLGEAGPCTFVAANALTMKVREHGRVSNAVVLIATVANGDGHRQVLDMRLATSETGAAWNSSSPT